MKSFAPSGRTRFKVCHAMALMWSALSAATVHAPKPQLCIRGGIADFAMTQAQLNQQQLAGLCIQHRVSRTPIDTSQPSPIGSINKSICEVQSVLTPS